MASEPRPMDPETLEAWRDLAARTLVPGEHWRMRRSPGRVDVISVRDGIETEVIAANIASDAKAAMLAFGPSDLAALLADRDYQAQRAEAAERDAAAHREAAANLRPPVHVGGDFHYLIHSPGGADCPREGWHFVFGGPYDSYTMPMPDDEGVLCWYRFDHDEGCWREMESLAARIVFEEQEIEAEQKLEKAIADRDAARAENARLEGLMLGKMPPGWQDAIDVDHPEAWRQLALARGAENARLRSRVRVEAEDVERAGVTRAHVEAWLAARDGWKRIDDGVHPDISVWQRPAHGFVRVADGPWLVETVVALTRSERMSGLDILDEMAAASVEAPGPRTSDPDYWDDAAKNLQLTRAKCEAWLGANGWVRATSPRAKAASEWRNEAMHHTVFLHDDPSLLLAALAGITRDKSELGRILDEMGRMPTETSAG